MEAQRRSIVEYTKEQKKGRAIRRVAEVIFGFYEEGATGIHSRIFEVLVHDVHLENGRSAENASYREHVVPLALLRDECLNMFVAGSSIEDVTNFLDRHLRVVLITPEQANYMDHNLKLKQKMPDGWRFGIDDPLARLHEAGISLE